MGSTFSSLASNDIIMYNIKNTVNELMNDYEIWANDQLCNNFELIYNGKLITLSDVQLKGIIAMIGYNNSENLSKDDLCQIIINHYKRKIELLKSINETIDKCNNMIHRAKNGKYCLNVNTFIDDFYTCNQIDGAIWIDKDEYKIIIHKLKKQDRLKGMLIWIEGLDGKYNESVKKLTGIIDMIKKDVDESEFKIIEAHTYKTLEYMVLICEIYYLLAINYK